MGGKEVADDNGDEEKSAEALVRNAYAEALELHRIGSPQWAATTCQIPSGVGLAYRSLTGNDSGLRGYLCGWLRLQEQPSLRRADSRLVVDFMSFWFCSMI